MDKLINVNSYPINKVLKYLLMDKTTGKNIIWATDTYTTNGRYKDTDTIETVDLIGFDSLVLQPRIGKSLEEQQQRTRKKAEVFTPVWLCNHMNNYCDEQWFGRKDVFNIEREDHTWKVIKDKIEFPKGKNWKKYVDSRRLEITCGEAPFITSRYDMATGDLIFPPRMRIGVLDRKMRIVNENAPDDEWLKWTIRAFQACYGYEYQGDNLLIARINMLLSFSDYYLHHFEEEPDLKIVRKVANIISWNIWQMDGLHDVVPKGSMNEVNHQFNIFEMFISDDEPEHKEDIPCKIFNWRSNESLFCKDCKGDKSMSKKFFDFCIGNPPYQGDNENNGRKPPVYNLFMDEVFKIATTVELITPARFLFNAGQTPKAWNEKMLNDIHFKVLDYAPDASKIFPNTEIKGGVAVSLRDELKEFGALKVFTAFHQLNDIVKKVSSINTDGKFLDEVISSRGNYRTTEAFAKDFPYASERLGKGTGNMIASNFFEKIPESFMKYKPDKGDYIGILARINNKREICYIDRKYVQSNPFINGYNLACPKSNGNGVFGEVLTSMEILKPNEGATDTFISIGNMKTEQEIINLNKYVKTKFFRALLGVKKVTQDNPKSVWNMIPLQDFTDKSDIYWSKPIFEIDQQLYHKYRLNRDEINFIETMVKEMK